MTLQDFAPFLMILVITGILVCLVVLYIGINMWQQDRKPKTPAASPEPGPASNGAETSAPKPALHMPDFLTGLTRPREPHGATGSAHEVLRVLRDRLTGRVVIEIGGKRYSQFGEIDDPTIRQGMAITLRDLQEFAGASSASAPSAEGAQPAPAAMASTPQVSAVQPIATMPTAPRPSTPATPPPLRMPSMNPFKQMQVLREVTANPPPPLKTIPEQIDDVLQVLVAGTPHMSRGMHVRAGPRGNVLFEVDGQAFNAVDDLPDPEAQALFRDAIKRWEHSQ